MKEHSFIKVNQNCYCQSKLLLCLDQRHKLSKPKEKCARAWMERKLTDATVLSSATQIVWGPSTFKTGYTCRAQSKMCVRLYTWQSIQRDCYTGWICRVHCKARVRPYTFTCCTDTVFRRGIQDYWYSHKPVSNMIGEKQFQCDATIRIFLEYFRNIRLVPACKKNDQNHCSLIHYPRCAEDTQTHHEMTYHPRAKK